MVSLRRQAAAAPVLNMQASSQGHCTAWRPPGRGASPGQPHLDHLQHRRGEHLDAGARVLRGGEVARRARAALQVRHHVRAQLLQDGAPLQQQG